MRRLKIFGERIAVVEKKSAEESVELKDGKIVVQSCKAGETLLKDFLADVLYAELCSIYEGIKITGRVELFGNLDFKVVEKIDGRKERIAKFKGNKVLVKLNAIVLPKEALRYVVAHELAHISVKRHTRKFWKVVETIYPRYETGQELFSTHRTFLANYVIVE